MIELTRLNNDKFILNALYIEQIQAFPDTTISLTNGKKIVVQEKECEVLEKANLFYQNIGLTSLNVKSIQQSEEG
ncbi:flagellar FlbD family protein [Evansella cellulosilytica]|uniref:Flagellar FlbD family protein n=1 Tax=Evansella cellulosilytica (strain ATCC 21833 / DSM 2522 / FERM P-1141 / JCM 9156 / N-4) TaxID=649639 RepID=E6TSV8_EVAC2|nr:flagellar FlbD family protein [Evansella cellulosilytica]ADU30750.1 flagellar FlbD family protein [Evansella cellulosilytica DSM 2522]